MQGPEAEASSSRISHLDVCCHRNWSDDGVPQSGQGSFGRTGALAPALLAERIALGGLKSQARELLLWQVAAAHGTLTAVGVTCPARDRGVSLQVWLRARQPWWH